jgi:hypothetical protein
MYYDVTSWGVRVMFVPPQLSKQPDTVTLEEAVFMAIFTSAANIKRPKFFR